jgi:agmatine/peptidylarginine deiminase
MTRVELLVEPNNSIWTRDYGPWFVFDGTDQLVIVDHVYNRPSRPSDDLIPVVFGAQQGIPVVRHDMWHTGGNYMTDGAAISASTDLVYDEAAAANGMSPQDVDDLMSDYYGIGDYNVVEDIEAGGIHHIDTWGKFLDEETILIKEVWPSHYTYDDLEQRAVLIGSLEASTGRTYRVERVYCHDIGGGRPASYTNSLIANDAIYVPTFGSAQNDAAALAAYEAAAPGYLVRGYTYGGWLTDDALHCRAKGVMDAGMLRVAHVPVREDVVGPATLTAEIRDHSGSGVAVAEVHYRQGRGAWQVLAMTNVSGDLYEAMIPAPQSPETTEYYIHAEDGSGRSEGMPRTEPAAWYAFLHGATTVAVGEPAGGTAPLTTAPVRSPFRSSTVLAFELRRADRVDVAVVDVRGRLVRRLLSETAPAGRTEIEWDGRDTAGRRVAPGVYRFVLRAAGIVYTRPVVRID